MAESTVNVLDKNYLYTRLELVDKDDLLRPARTCSFWDHARASEFPPRRAYTFGGARDIWNTDKVSMAIGIDVTFYSKPPVLDQFYGNNPVSWWLFLRIRPAKMKMGNMHSMHGNVGAPQKPPSNP